MLVDAARRHAGMGRFDHDRDAFGLEHLVERLGDLVGQPFLELEPTGVGIDQPGKLGDADDAALRTVGHVSDAADLGEMMLAGRDNRNVAQQDGLVIAFSLGEGPAQQRFGIDAVASEP